MVRDVQVVSRLFDGQQVTRGGLRRGRSTSGLLQVRHSHALSCISQHRQAKLIPPDQPLAASKTRSCARPSPLKRCYPLGTSQVHSCPPLSQVVAVNRAHQTVLPRSSMEVLGHCCIKAPHTRIRLSSESDSQGEIDRCATSTINGAAQLAITKALRNMGRTDIRIHDLRYTGQVLAAQSGATIADLMARLGHSSVNAAMKYAHAAGDHGRQVADRMDAARATGI